MSLHALLDVYAAALGLIAGSYLNVVIHRLPRGLSTVLPRSACPACGAPIAARDNVPLVSFLLLGGRCRACRAPIAWRYPLVEAATALLFVGCLERFGLSLAAFAGALFCCLMIALALIDLEHFILPDRLTLPGIVAGLALQPWLPWGGIRPALAGTALGAGVLLAIRGGWQVLHRTRRGTVAGEESGDQDGGGGEADIAGRSGEADEDDLAEGMGLGDVKMLALIGAFLGWQPTLVALLIASCAGALTGLALILRGGAGMRTKLPFGSFLALGGVAALFAGRELAAWYAGFL